MLSDGLSAGAPGADGPMTNEAMLRRGLSLPIGRLALAPSDVSRETLPSCLDSQVMTCSACFGATRCRQRPALR
jgi:hypothetical protein